jgi:hypothetical protein
MGASASSEGALEGKEDLAANQVRVVQRLEPGCDAPPLILSEVVVLNADGEDEVIVRD